MTDIDTLFGRVIWVINSIFNTLLEEKNSIIPNIKMEVEP
jgi:hypothetical protein